MGNNLRIDEQIRKSDKVICRHISSINNATRGEISQDISMKESRGQPENGALQ